MGFLGLRSYHFALWSEMLTVNQDWVPHPKRQNLEDYLQNARGLLENPELHLTEIMAKWKIISVKKMNADSARELSLDNFLQNAKEDPEMKRRLFDNPELQPLTETPEWQILCAMKMDPESAGMMHLVWAMSRGNMLFSTKEENLGSASVVLLAMRSR
jgi:hypothetical protein